MLSLVCSIVVWYTLPLAKSLPSTSVANNHVIGYPEVEENYRIRNKDGRNPIYLPSMCPDNELFYPGDQSSDWICDCRPAHLYHPDSNKCWPAWRRGPCPEGRYLVLTATSAIPVCRKNPCREDGLVRLDKKCVRLGEPEVCKHLFPTDAVLGVNATTLIVECVRLSLDTIIPARPGIAASAAAVLPEASPRTERPQTQYLITCAPGSKRKLEGHCVDGS